MKKIRTFKIKVGGKEFNFDFLVDETAKIFVPCQFVYRYLVVVDGEIIVEFEDSESWDVHDLDLQIKGLSIYLKGLEGEDLILEDIPPAELTHRLWEAFMDVRWDIELPGLESAGKEE